MDLAESILKQRYYQEGEDWPKLVRRVAHAVAQGEAGKGMEDQFYNLMLNKVFLPNSPTLMNAGLDDGTLSACFTVDVEDSMVSILDTVKEMAIIGKFGGGVGCNWSKLRSSGSKVGSTNGVASGAVSFLELVNTMCDVVKQGGRRRIAVMSILDATHPDIKEFITAKTDGTKLNNMNLSVMIDNKFMEYLSENDKETQETWDLIVKTAHATGEPGILFYDTINKDNITPHIPIRATNPCAEEPMIPYGSCNLLSIDVSKLVKDGVFNFVQYYDVIKTCVHFADAVIDVNKYPLKKIEEVAKDYRQIGLGIMGFSTALIKMGIRYGSDISYRFAAELADGLRNTAEYTSMVIGDELGYFPKWKETNIIFPRRNAYLTSIAPTGTISTIAGSTIAGCSFGIEPLFAVAYTRKIMDKSYTIVDPLFMEMMHKVDISSEEVVNQIVGKKSIQNVSVIPNEIRELFVTAHDLTPKEHVDMLATFQKHIDAGVSKTVNMPESSTIEEVDKLFCYAFEKGCKGITIYRENSREVPITTEVKVIDKDYIAPDITEGYTLRFNTGCGHLHINVTGIKGQPLKVFGIPTTGGCKASIEGISRLASLNLRSGVIAKLIIKQLSKVVCPACVNNPKVNCKSCADAIGKALQYMLDHKMITNNGNKLVHVVSFGICLITCENCKQEYMANIKCSICPHCGFSKCM